MEIPYRDKYFGALSIGVCGPCKCEVGNEYESSL